MMRGFPSARTTVDAVGLLCPLPIARTAARVRELGEGEVLELLADDPLVLVDIPNWCRAWRHEYLGHEEAEGILRLFVQKGVVST